MSTAATMESILTFVNRDPGVNRSVTDRDMLGGLAGGRMMNNAIGAAIDALGVNDDGILSPEDLRAISDHIRANPALYGEFVIGHGDDEGDEETGFHLVQGNGGTLQFQGRDYVDTVADAIYHAGFRYEDGRFKNEDGNANETVADVAGWLNYFVNGDNRVYGSSRSETLHSGDYSHALRDAANEIFHARGGDDKIWAGDGDDIILAGTGDDVAGAGDGNDTVMGDVGNDRMMGNGGRDKVYGGDGYDLVTGDDGSDFLYGGLHGDKVYGGNGHDRAYGGAGFDHMGGGAGDDTLWGANGDDVIWGDAGFDRIYGGNGDDEVGGGDNSDIVRGDAGRDRVHGQDGHDRLFGGDGNDRVYGGHGQDRVYGDDGFDEIHAGDSSDWIYGGGKNDHIFAGTGNDMARGGWGHDIIHGQDGNDRINGDQGDDQVFGGDGNDLLIGGDGNDELIGGRGGNTFQGGAGADILNAWEAEQTRDVFIFNPGDTGITSATRDYIDCFASGIDKMDLTGFGGLRWVADGDLTGRGHGEVTAVGKLVMIDGDGDGQIDAMVSFRGPETLERGDFWL